MAVRGIAIETSGRDGSIAAVVDGQTVHVERSPHDLKHAAGLVTMLGRVVKGAGWQESEVDHVYLSIGPGSFTGLRIGVTLVKSWWLARQMELAANIKVVAVPTVRVIVENLPPSARHAAVVLDAKRGQIFTASYSRNEAGLWQERRPARVDTLASVIAADPKPLTLIGEGLPYHPPQGPEEGTERAGPELAAARAEALGRIGFSMAEAGQFSDPMTLVPTYIRLPEAEEKWRLERGLSLADEGVLK